MIHILMVDDQEVVRAGVRFILSSFPDLALTGEVADGFAALDFLAGHPEVNLVLLDIRMPGIDGVETTRRMRADPRYDDVHILILTTFESDENVLAALRAGANGFLSKGMSAAEFSTGIRETNAGTGALSASARQALISHAADSPVVPRDKTLEPLFLRLTPREREAVVAAAGGLDNKQIAAQLCLSPLTVKTHISRAMAKVDARDRAQLVAFAFKAGLA